MRVFNKELGVVPLLQKGQYQGGTGRDKSNDSGRLLSVVVSRVSAPDKPRLFVQEDPKHTCQVTYSSDVTGSHLQVTYSSDRVSTLRVNVSQIDTKVRHPDPDPWMTTPGIVEAPDAPTQLEN